MNTVEALTTTLLPKVAADALIIDAPIVSAVGVKLATDRVFDV